MARIKDTSVEAVKQAANIVDVVSLRTSLRRDRVAAIVGRCPFHEERTPSFSVNPDLDVYYCFGCGKGGDVVRFVRETESLDFVGAIEWLADRFRVTLEYEETSPEAEKRVASVASGSYRRARAGDRVLRAHALGGRRRGAGT